MTYVSRLAVCLLCVAVISGASSAANGAVVGIKLTANALGLGTSDINRGKTVDPDLPGFITSGVSGEGSILSIQTNGLAGTGTVTDPSFVTLTATEHLDVVFGVPQPSDYQAGVIFISKESTGLPDGKDEGIGVRAFTVIGSTGLREIDSATGRAKIEGSKDVSGGTDPLIVYDPNNPNGSPHVDEAVKFTFDDAFDVQANSVEVLLSKFSLTDVIDLGLQLNLESGLSTAFTFLGTGNTAVLEQIGTNSDKLWKLKFSGIAGLTADDLIKSFEIRAIDDNPSDPSATAEHFLITGLNATYGDSTPGGGNSDPVVPEPSSVVIWLLLGLCGFGVRRWRQRR